MKLFDDEWGVDNSPIEDVEITTTLLYFSKEELKEFKRHKDRVSRRIPAKRKPQ